MSHSGVLLRSLIVLAALGARLLAAQPALAQSVCTITQITHSSGFGNFSGDPSLDGGAIAFVSSVDLTGENPDGNGEIFFFDGSTIIQITHSAHGSGSPFASSSLPSLDGGSIAFNSNANLTGDNPDGHDEIFLYDGATITQITPSTAGFSEQASLDRGSIAFASSSDLTGGNPDGNREIFLYDGSTITQITHSTVGDSYQPSLDGDSIAFASSANLTAGNADGSTEIFLFNGATTRQITDSPNGYFSAYPSLDSGSIAFHSEANLTGDNPERRLEVFLYDGSTITQITDSATGGSDFPSLDGSSIAFTSRADLTGGNPDGNNEIFLYNGTAITQITQSGDGGDSRQPRLDGSSIAFQSSADLTGNNPQGNEEIFLAACDGLAPPPPPGPFLTPDEIPGFQFKVRISAGDNVISGQQEADCIRETLCVSGALPGRSELFLRIIGPRPNGFLWTNLVRFTPSRVEVWAEQIGSGTVNYYDLPALPREDTELTGLVDKQAFPPPGSVAEAVASAIQPIIRARDLTLWEPDRFHHLASSATGRPGALTFTSPAFPDFRFTVKIFSGGEEQPVQVEQDCIPETICVSGALPGRSELFLRIIGPRPNGFLWTNLVRFTTSRVEVEIEQLTTGETNTYVLDEVPRQSDQLPGRVDREAFLP